MIERYFKIEFIRIENWLIKRLETVYKYGVAIFILGSYRFFDVRVRYQ